ncbi:MAG TPA: AbrB/MazE/SpoVT family DNA-binding domain-containing protein [Acidimicrobiales bacterium]|nr:AbrB/MazE/SpoVT family DNA-binding domain-containing protein [Acidimicrobiales bacterium]
MRTTIDRAGRIVVPKAIRERLGLGAGVEVEVVERDGTIEITPSALAVVIEETPEGPVAVAVEPVPPLTQAEVLAAIDASRR